MAERPQRQGGLRIDPAVAAFQKQAATNTAALTAKQRRDRKRVRLNLDLDAETRNAVEAIAERESTSVSQAASLLLAFAAREYAHSNSVLLDGFQEQRKPARTPRFEWMVETPETWLTEIEHLHAYGEVKR